MLNFLHSLEVTYLIKIFSIMYFDIFILLMYIKLLVPY